ncbi:MAG: hypothetical protein AAF581_18125 [Planctomycetota bacterium]
MRPRLFGRSMVTLASLLLLVGVAHGQDLEEKYKAKLEKAFMSKISWEQSLEEAMKKSKETGKPIFGYFTRSYSP